MSEGLQSDKRPQYSFGPGTFFFVFSRPFLPSKRDIFDGLRHIHPARGRSIGMGPSQAKWNLLALFDNKFRSRLHVLAAQRNGGGKPDLIGASNRAQHVVRYAADPRNHGSIFKANDQLHPHLHAASNATHQPQDVLMLTAPVHTIHQNDGPFWSGEFGLQNESSISIAPVNVRALGFRLNRPVAVLLRSQQAGKASGRIKTREAEPVYRSISSDQRGCSIVADK